MTGLYLKVTNETVRATQEVIATTSTTRGQEPDTYFNEFTPLYTLLSEVEEPITDRQIIVFGLQEAALCGGARCRSIPDADGSRL